LILQPCRSCGHEVSTEALSCPHCGAPKPTAAAKEKERAGKQTLAIGCLGLLVVLVIFAVVGSEGPSASAGAARTPDKITVYTMGQTFVERSLRAPQSARHPWGSDSYLVDQLAPNRWRVRSYVDAQNAFGASIRTCYDVTMTMSGGSWTLEAISTTPWPSCAGIIR